MQGRSWMAALTLAAVLIAAHHALARAEDTTASGKVKLMFFIRGLGREGCDIEVKPAHAGCHFSTVRKHVNYGGEDIIMLKDVTTTNADRDCAVAITMREPGQPVRTVRRGIRLAAPEKATASYQVLHCLLNSPSQLVAAEQQKKKLR